MWEFPLQSALEGKGNIFLAATPPLLKHGVQLGGCLVK